jgi:hypothetical protein
MLLVGDHDDAAGGEFGPQDRRDIETGKIEMGGGCDLADDIVPVVAGVEKVLQVVEAQALTLQLISEPR